MTTHTAPVGEELRTYLDKARTSKVRIATNKGDIVFTFYPDDAPQHSAAFIKLAEAGFYDGLKFHRVEPGFVIQGGDPEGNGTGGPGYRLKAEFNTHPHVRGTVADKLDDNRVAERRADRPWRLHFPKTSPSPTFLKLDPKGGMVQNWPFQGNRSGLP